VGVEGVPPSNRGQDARDTYGEALSPEQIVHAAARTGCKSIAYTYTEPTIFMELANDCARPAKERGLANVFVSNGYMTREAIDFAADWLDAINVDLKAFNEDYYRNFCAARLQPVWIPSPTSRSTRRSGWKSRRCCCRGRTTRRRSSSG
jgi:pyruvate-formate lyase-activating enzyme